MIHPIPWPYVTFCCNKLIFYGEELLAPHLTPKLEDHPLSAPLLFIQYIRSYLPCLEAVFSIRNPRARHAVVTGTHIT